jgi:hypothetical protein
MRVDDVASNIWLALERGRHQRLRQGKGEDHFQSDEPGKSGEGSRTASEHGGRQVGAAEAPGRHGKV